MINENNFESLKTKEQLICNAAVKLKEEFVGIDNVIDGVIDNIKSWYLFPELYKTPMVINLFGMTGTGKTSLVNRLSKLLNLESDLFCFNFAEIGECTAWEIEDRISDELSDERSNRVFVYDEFQYAATIRDGEETDKKSGLKPFWEILDSGRMHKRNNYWEMRNIYSAACFLSRINDAHRIELVNGVWVNASKCLENFSRFEINKFKHLLVFDESERISQPEVKTENAPHMAMTPKHLSNDSGDFFLETYTWRKVVSAVNRFEVSADGGLDLYKKVCNMEIEEVIEFLMSVYDRSCKGYDLDFHNSIVFVIANVDEAYEMAFNVNPDMSADAFHEETKHITIVDIKNALRARFRNEQIARLGNIHHIYPSFASETFREIIRREIKKFCDEIERMIGVKTEYEPKLVKMVYDESVFPTHGARPVLSSISDMFKSKVANIALYLYENNVKASRLVFTCSRSKLVINIYGIDGKRTKRLTYKPNLRVEPLRKVTEDKRQVITAIHESGHFIVYAALFGKLPEKLVSVSVSSNANGFMQHDIKDSRMEYTFEELKDNVAVTLAGYVAESLVLGKGDMTAGAAEDIARATEMVTNMYRKWGYDRPIGSTIIRGDSGEKRLVLEYENDNNNSEIRRIIEECRRKAENVLKESSRALLESSKHLLHNAAMKESKMREIALMIPESVKNNVKDDAYYIGKLENMCQSDIH